MRVGVFGAGGRMGSTVCRAVADDPDLELVAAVDPRLAGIDINQVAGVQGSNVQVEGDAEAFVRAQTQVAVDFTEVEAARDNLRWCAANGGRRKTIESDGNQNGCQFALISFRQR